MKLLNILMLGLVLSLGCGTNDAETETPDANYDATISGRNPMAQKDTGVYDAKISNNADTKPAEKPDAKMGQISYDASSNSDASNPFACYIPGCAYPDVGCCWIGSVGGACLANASCSIEGAERFGCICR